MTAPAYTTQATTFPSAGLRCAATLYLPQAGGRHPLVVMAHGFAGTQQACLPAFAEVFAAAGMAVMIFDYRHFGASEGQPRLLLDIGRQLDDWRAAVAHARGLAQVDAQRIALWGTSFSGGHVLTLAAEMPDLRAVVAQVAFTDGLAQLGDPVHALRLSARGLLDAGKALLGLAPVTIGVVGKPGALAAMTSPDAEPGYLRMVEGLVDWRNEVAARIVLTLPLYRPIAGVARIQAPVLFVIAEDDAVTPTKPAYKAAARTPKAEVLTVPGGHFDPYVAPLFERIAAAESAFLRKHLF